MNNGKIIYFASDFHLGVPTKKESLVREHKIIAWLDAIKHNAASIYLLGDLFDFWFEYRTVVPKGYVRLLGKLAELRDVGIPIHYYAGNHDLWMFGYFEEELNIPVHREPELIEIHGKKFLIGHGDGIGPGDHGYKFIKKVFSNKFCQWLFALVHPSIGMRIANYWSMKSRTSNGDEVEQYLGDDKEWLLVYAKERLQKEHIDYFIFGHRHLPLDIDIDKSRYLNLGDWITHFSYATFDGEKLELTYYKED